MPSETIVDSKLKVHLDLSPSVYTNSKFLADPANRAHLANQILLYDQIGIPTQDFGIIPTLIAWLGQTKFEKALDSGAFQFLHKSSMLGYAGAGSGLVAFEVQPSPARSFEWWQQAAFSAVPEATELQLRHMCPSIGHRHRSKLVASVSSHSVELDISASRFARQVENETYLDIQNSRGLSAFLIALCGNSETRDLRRLPGVNPNDMKVSHYGPIKEPADLVLRIAEVNLALLTAADCNNCDLFAPDGAEQLLKSKLLRRGIGSSMVENFCGLLELTSLPDPGAAVASGDITVSDVWRIRDRKVSREFRKWLRQADPTNKRELEKLYVASLGKKGFHESLPGRVLRFAITTAAGVLNPVLGTGLSIADSFFVDDWLHGFTPKVFLDQLSSINRERAVK